MRQKSLIISLFTLLSLCAAAQSGYGVYQFLDLPASSRIAALGSNNVSLQDNDLNLAFQNPSLLNAQTGDLIGLSAANYLADVTFGTVVYGKNFNKNNYMAFGIQYIDYGDFKGMNEQNEYQGNFTAKDITISVMYARPLNEHISIGLTFKPIYSVYESYHSFGLATDVGLSYNDPESLFSAGLVFRNMGTQIKGYYAEEGDQHLEPLAYNILLGITKKFQHAPLRISGTLHNLQRWDLSYQSTNQQSSSLIGSENNEIGFFDMAFRHAIFGVEFIPNKNFYLAVGYNHRRRQEMAMNGFKSMAGFSFGGGIKVYKFHVGFGMTQFQLGAYSYQFSISTSLNEFNL